jgi:hypothetical protein
MIILRALFISRFEYTGERQYSKSSIKVFDPLSECPAISGDSETSPGGGVG